MVKESNSVDSSSISTEEYKKFLEDDLGKLLKELKSFVNKFDEQIRKDAVEANSVTDEEYRAFWGEDLGKHVDELMNFANTRDEQIRKDAVEASFVTDEEYRAFWGEDLGKHVDELMNFANKHDELIIKDAIEIDTWDNEEECGLGIDLPSSIREFSKDEFLQYIKYAIPDGTKFKLKGKKKADSKLMEANNKIFLR